MTDAAPRPVNQLVPKVARTIARLSPGPAAALRRDPARESGTAAYWGSGTAAYWRLVAQLEKDGLQAENPAWETIIQSIAILTPRGQDPKKRSSHDPTVAMGAALFNAQFSELRLAQLLNAPPAARRRLVVRTCRRLASSGHYRFDLRTLAGFVLAQNSDGACCPTCGRPYPRNDGPRGAPSDKPAQHIAREYYRAEARQSISRSQEETST